jgi:hypothetical protein
MIGRTIESAPGFPWAALLLLLLAVALCGASVVAGNTHAAIASILPLLMGPLVMRERHRPFVAEFTSDALEAHVPELLRLPYDEIESLRPGRRDHDPHKAGPRAYRIQVLHRDGALNIPARLNVRSDLVYQFLYERLPLSGSREVTPALADYLKQQLQTFGPERVWSYRARAHLRAPSPGIWRPVVIASVLTGIIWIALGMTMGEDYRAWIVMGCSSEMLGGAFAFVGWAGFRETRRDIKHWRQSGLVIGPGGLALVQGDLQGEMRWDELKNVRYKPKYGAFDTHAPSLGIVLTLAGAEVAIANIYDRPLYLIYERIMAYWR